jgi:glycosyltransferase involved in cell wall biosynthesis
MKISIVIPCYGDLSYLESLCLEINTSLEKNSAGYEIILVDDGNPKEWLPHFETLKLKFHNLRVLHFDKNKGEHRALDAGISAASGDYVATLACDGQDDPAYLSHLIEVVEKKLVDVVSIYKVNRSVSRSKQFFAKCFYKLIPLLCGLKQKQPGGNYKLLGPKAKKALKSDLRPHWPLPLRLEFLNLSHASISGKDRASKAQGSTYRFIDSLILAMKTIALARFNYPRARRETFLNFKTTATVYSETVHTIRKDLVWLSDTNSLGFKVLPVYSSLEQEELCDFFEQLLLKKSGLKSLNTGFYSRYHENFSDDEKHLNFIKSISPGLEINSFPLSLLAKLRDHLESTFNNRIRWAPPSNEYSEGFSIRIVRPNTQDSNPLHRDTWLPRLIGATNLYIPLFGSDQNSSLQLCPGTHNVSDEFTLRASPGAMINGKQYSVPSLMSYSASHPLNLIRPNTGCGEVLAFSSHLIHGGASNLNPNKTRFSLEMRIWPKS